MNNIFGLCSFGMSYGKRQPRVNGLKVSPFIACIVSTVFQARIFVIRNYSSKRILSQDSSFLIKDGEKPAVNTAYKKSCVHLIENGMSCILDPQKFIASVKSFSKIHLDLGTGDAKFVYQQAKANPTTLYIGVDTSPEGMCAISIKVKKKPSKGGGISNVAFIHAHAECLPNELNNIADSISINFPWAGLLRAVVLPETEKLRKISNLGKNNSELSIQLNNEVLRDLLLCKKLDLPTVDEKYIKNIITKEYHKNHIKINKYTLIDTKSSNTSWGKKLVLGSHRSVLLFDCVIRRQYSS